MLNIMTVYVLAVLLLCVGFHFSRILVTLKHVSNAARVAISTMTDSSLDDMAKEKAIQRYAVEMLKQTIALFTKVLLILLVTAVPVWLASTLGWIDMQTFTGFILRWDVLLLTTLAILLPAIVFRRFRKVGP